MATYTTNLNLKKPAQSDKIRIADINNNMDDIDAAFGAIGNNSVATQIGDIQDALAIVAVGDSHAAIIAGQYVYVKSHGTLDAGLYVASANIAQNGALSSSNLTADTAGGLNALNSNISNLIHMKTVSGTTNTGGNLNLGLGLITNKIIGAYLGYNSNGHGGYLLNAENYAWFHVVDGSGNAITNTNVTVDVVYVANWHVDT